VDPASGKFPLNFTLAGGASELRSANEPTIKCLSISGSGKYTSATTGEISLTFHGCTTEFLGFPVSCNSTSQGTGTVQFSTTVVHSTYLTDAKTTPGANYTAPDWNLYHNLLWASEEPCLPRQRSDGPPLGSEMRRKKKTATLSFAATGSSQHFKQATATGTVYSLAAETEVSSAVTAAMEAHATITFVEEATLTCL
jgi:hypothetical protein